MPPLQTQMEARLLGRKLIFLLASGRFRGIIGAREVAPMRLSDSISSILKHKGTRLLTVAPSAVVYEAIAMMAENGVGALLVVEDGLLVGILSERDYARKVILEGRSSRTTAVREIMSAPVIFVSPESAVGECMQIMTDHRIRHLPVLKGDQLMGVVSIGDLVNHILLAQSETIRHLENYISGTPR
jgi:CBS domain-containing protein